jgi:adenosyl cobinamide kinase/adenosyl cobinamide phosphate guanylyltransferase
MTARVTGQTTASVTLVLGGARSGKSRHAEALIESFPEPWLYVATAQAFDDEMAARLEEHRARRPAGWRTIEEPLDLPGALAHHGPMLVDCLTLWLSNLLLAEREPDFSALLAAIDARESPTVFVSNEVGLGIVPDNALARTFRDSAGLLHQRLAARADRVLFMVAGLPMVVK